MTDSIAQALHSNCTKTGAMQFERLESIARLHSIPGLPGDCCAIALRTMDRRKESKKRGNKAFSVKAIDWFPHINRNGYAVPVFWWVRTCLSCGAQVAKTGTTRSTNLPVSPCPCDAS